MADEFHDTHPLVNEIGEALRVGGLTHGAATRAARAIFALVSKRLTTDVHKPCEELLSVTRKCGRCGLAVSAGICDTPPLHFHDFPEQCIEALKAELARVRENARGDEP